MTIKQIEKKLSKILGNTYGGPSISYDPNNKMFILYEWGNAPIDMGELSGGYTLEALIINYEKQQLKTIPN